MDPSTADDSSQMPLLCATKRGHKEVVKPPLERSNIKPDAGDKHGRTLLW